VPCYRCFQKKDANQIESARTGILLAAAFRLMQQAGDATTQGRQGTNASDDPYWYWLLTPAPFPSQLSRHRLVEPS
jgi:hypothetical protein